MAHTVLELAWLRTTRGEYHQATRLLSALSRINDRIDRGLSREVGALVVAERGIIQAARKALGDREFAAAWAEGESLTLEQVCAEILASSSAC
jgi:hypothetical protein